MIGDYSICKGSQAPSSAHCLWLFPTGNGCFELRVYGRYGWQAVVTGHMPDIRGDIIALQKGLKEETERATEAETALQENIDAETERAVEAEEALQDAVGSVQDLLDSLEIVQLSDEEVAALGDGANVLKAYALCGSGGERKGSVIEIYKDSHLKEASYADQCLTFVYVLADGSEETVTVDMGELLAETEYGAGLTCAEGRIKVLLDPAGEDFLSVSSAGVKLSGVQDAIDEAVQESSDGLKEALDEETASRQEADSALEAKDAAIEEDIEALKDSLKPYINNTYDVVSGDDHVNVTKTQDIVERDNGSSGEDIKYTITVTGLATEEGLETETASREDADKDILKKLENTYTFLYNHDDEHNTLSLDDDATHITIREETRVWDSGSQTFDYTIGESDIASASSLASAEEDIASLQEKMATKADRSDLTVLRDDIEQEVDSLTDTVYDNKEKIASLEEAVGSVSGDLLGYATKEELEAETERAGNAESEISSEISTLKEACPVTITSSSDDGNVLKTYTFTQDGSVIGTVDIPLDMVVTRGEVKLYPFMDGDNLEQVMSLILHIANQEEPVVIPVSMLVPYVYSGGETDRIAVSVSEDCVISADIREGSIGWSDLSGDATGMIATKDDLVELEGTVSALEGTVESLKEAIESGLGDIEGGLSAYATKEELDEETSAREEGDADIKEDIEALKDSLKPYINNTYDVVSGDDHVNVTKTQDIVDRDNGSSGEDITYTVSVTGLATEDGLEAETAAREAADEALSSSISESYDRFVQDIKDIEGEFQQRVDGVSEDRKNGDEALQAEIDALKAELGSVPTVTVSQAEGNTHVTVSQSTGSDGSVNYEVAEENIASADELASTQDTVSGLSTTVESLEKDVSSLETTVDSLSTSVDGMQTIIEGLTGDASGFATKTELESSLANKANTSALTDGSVTKIGTSTVGGTAQPVYIKSGTPTALSSTVGSSTKPVYLSGGTITSFSSTIGSSTKPVYLNAGAVTACSIDMNTLQSSVSSLEASTSTLQSSVSSLETSTSTLQSSVSSLETSTSTLQSSVSSLETSTSTLQSSVSSLETSTSTLQSSVSSLEASSSTHVVNASGVAKIQALSQSEYNALSKPDSTTLYIITSL